MNPGCSRETEMRHGASSRRVTSVMASMAYLEALRHVAGRQAGVSQHVTAWQAGQGEGVG